MAIVGRIFVETIGQYLSASLRKLIQINQASDHGKPMKILKTHRVFWQFDWVYEILFVDGEIMHFSRASPIRTTPWRKSGDFACPAIAARG